MIGRRKLHLNNYVAKHIGLTLLIVGFVMLVLQICGMNQMFPLDTIIILVSIIFQIIGWREPYWFMIEFASTSEDNGRRR